jgi:MoxR-like ATPase
MTLFYRAHAGERPGQPITLPDMPSTGDDEPQTYLPDAGLVHAVNTALLLGRPLLVTGEPGTGKTQLAASIAFQLGYDPPLRFVAKSVSQAPDLFYSFDSVGRFTASQTAPSVSRTVVEFIRYNALGQAILYANEPSAVKHLLARDMRHPGLRRSVVLIDEVDKAPRDFPNDILSELERMEFRVPELGETVRARPEWRPVVVITSNSERGLPDAFLRRCVYYDIPFPTIEGLDAILKAKLASRYARDFAHDALEVLELLRDEQSRLSKKPSTAELIGWMLVLLERDRTPAANGVGHRDSRPNPLRDRRVALETLGVLVKSRDDLRHAQRVIELWIARA